MRKLKSACCAALCLAAFVTHSTAQVNAISAPSDGAQFLTSESVTIQVNASDPVGMNAVRLWKTENGANTYIAIDNTPPYSFVITGLAEGEHTYFSRAKNNNNETNDSDPVTVSIVNSYNQIVSPSSGISVDVGSTVTITADVADADGIDSVRLWEDDGVNPPTVIGLLNSPPFTWNVTKLSASEVTYHTRSKDDLNNILDSNLVTVSYEEDYNRIITPDPGATFTDVESFFVTSEVVDSNEIASVELFQDAGSGYQSQGSITAPPYSWEFSSLSAGSYTYYTSATDGQNNVTDSEPVTVTITQDDGTGNGTFPLVGTTIVLTANANDKYVSAENPNDELIANSIEIGPYEQFEVVDNQGFISFKNVGNGKYVAADQAGNASLKANRDNLGSYERFSFTERGNAFSIRADVNGKWVSAEAGGDAPLIANRTEPRGWEEFTFSEVLTINPAFPAYGSTVAFISGANGQYVSADNANNELIANATTIGDYEKFEVEYLVPPYVALKNVGTGQYVSADNAGVDNLKANSATIGIDEEFEFSEHSSNGSIAFIANVNNKYVAAEAGGSAPLIANRNNHGGWESFTFTDDFTGGGDTGGGDTGGGDTGGGGTGGGGTGGGGSSDGAPTCGTLVSIANIPVDQSKLNVGPMVGHTTDSSAMLWVIPKNTNNVKAYVKLSSGSDYYSFNMSKADSSDESYRVDVDCLAAETDYDYHIVVDGNRIIGSGEFTTAPAEGSGTKLTFGFTSCGKYADDSQQTGWWHMKDIADPDFILYLGDTIYTNATARSDYNRSYRQAKGIPSFENLIKDVPTYTGLDDHDYGGNNSHKGWPGRAASFAAYKDAWATPVGNNDGAYYSFKWGDVEFFVLDNRRHRTNPSGFNKNDSVMFGQTQLNWLKNGLKNSTAKFKLICQGGGWNGGPTNGEGFYGYPTEMQNLRSHIINNSIDGIIHLSGDIHKNQVRYADDGGKSMGDYPLWDIIASGIGRSNKAGLWAKVEIDTTIADPTFTVTFYSQDVPTTSDVSSKVFIPSGITHVLKLSDLQNN